MGNILILFLFVHVWGFFIYNDTLDEKSVIIALNYLNVTLAIHFLVFMSDLCTHWGLIFYIFECSAFSINLYEYYK